MNCCQKSHMCIDNMLLDDEEVVVVEGEEEVVEQVDKQGNLLGTPSHSNEKGRVPAVRIVFVTWKEAEACFGNYEKHVGFV